MKEIHGVNCMKSPARVWAIEEGDTVFLDVSSASGARLTADEARHLARKLNRLARRIEFRAEHGVEP